MRIQLTGVYWAFPGIFFFVYTQYMYLTCAHAHTIHVMYSRLTRYAEHIRYVYLER